MSPRIRILIVDDHFVVRIGLLSSIATDPGLEVVAEASTAEEAFHLYAQHHPDVVLMDLRMPDLSGIDATARLCKDDPSARVIIFSSFDAPDEIYRAFQAGARGYLMKHALGQDLFDAVRAVAAGRRHVPPDIERILAEHTSGSDLTERELQVLQLLAKGLSNREIGKLLGFSENTAKFHLKNILAKLQVSDRTEAATAAYQRGILH